MSYKSGYESVITRQEFKLLKDQVYANHRLIQKLQKDNHAQAIELNRLTLLLKDNGK